MNERGFTLIEMIAVLLLIGIVATVIIGRYLSIQNIELMARVDTVRNHVRYAQAMAMKRNNMFWGIKCDGTAYWLFRTDDPDNAAEPDSPDNKVNLPGEKTNSVSLSTIGEISVSFTNMGAFTLYFDRYGKPYTYDTSTIIPVSAANPLSIQIDSKTLNITPETGFMQ